MSDTPRTDEVERRLGKTDCCFVIEPEFPTLIEFARQLERELEAVRHALVVTLPMAKGYAHEHQVGDNMGKVVWAEGIAQTRAVVN